MVGHSLREHVAAVISGILPVADTVKLVASQAQLLKSLPPDGGLLSILDSVDLFYGRPELFEPVTLDGVNFPGNFFCQRESPAAVSLARPVEAEGWFQLPYLPATGSIQTGLTASSQILLRLYLKLAYREPQSDYCIIFDKQVPRVLV